MKNDNYTESEDIISEDYEEIGESVESKDESKVSPILLASICFAIITIAVVVLLIVVTVNRTHNNKQQQSVAQESSSSVQQVPIDTPPPTESSTDAPVEPVLENAGVVVQTHDVFPEGSLNNNTWPFYEYSREDYDKYAACINSVTLFNGAPQEAAQEVKEAVICNMVRFGWPEVSYNICIAPGYDKWYYVYIDAVDMYLFVNRDYNICLTVYQDYEPEEVYRCASTIYNYFNDCNIELVFGPVDPNYYSIYAYGKGVLFILDKADYSIVSTEVQDLDEEIDNERRQQQQQ